MDILNLIFGLLVGGILALVVSKIILKSKSENYQKMLTFYEEKLSSVELENQNLIKENSALQADKAKIETQLKSISDEFLLEKNSFKQMVENSKVQFENLAEKILQEKSEKFNKNNAENLNAILKPLGENINLFKKQVSESYDKNTRQNSMIEERIKNLSEQTNKISDEANNLAKALKGNSKVQGDFGEIILERVLESSGLTKGREYKMQVNVKNEDEKNFRPDAIVYLPENRIIVIDSKMSLKSYESYFTAENTAAQEIAIKGHIDSIKSHINELAEKKYDSLVKNSPDFTMMFIPIEPAYLVALQQDNTLWEYAYKKHILLISPTNLMACLKMVESLWRQEKLAANAQAFADMGEKIYNKLVCAFESFEALGKSIQQAENAYTTTMNRLKDGRGSLLMQCQQLIELGVKSKKQLPQSFGEVLANEVSDN